MKGLCIAILLVWYGVDASPTQSEGCTGHQTDILKIPASDYILMRNDILVPEGNDIFVPANFFTDGLFRLIYEENYVDACQLSVYLYDLISDKIAGRKVIENVVIEMLKNSNYKVMNFAYKLIQNKSRDIVKNCFPGVFSAIYNGNGTFILNKNKATVLRLTSETDEERDSWLYSDCKKDALREKDSLWRFYPTWNQTLNAVVFKIHNSERKMNVKLGYQIFTAGIHYTNEVRSAYGDAQPEIYEVGLRRPGRFEWQLIPVGYNDSNDELLFCIYENHYSSYLMPNYCQIKEEDVKAMPLFNCSPEIGWFIETNEDFDNVFVV